jgi:ribonuclease HI
MVKPKRTSRSGATQILEDVFDGSLNIDGVGAGVLFISPNKDELRYILRLHFPASNNTAEYEACLHGIRIVVELGVKRLYVYGDLALVIN